MCNLFIGWLKGHMAAAQMNHQPFIRVEQDLTDNHNCFDSITQLTHVLMLA